jgi:ABC-type lipoprotein release transport system permease subunit
MATSASPTAISGIVTTGYATPTATPTGSTPTPVTVMVPVGSSYSSSSRSHTIAIAAGVGVAVGVAVALIIILAFILFRRRQTRKSSATISPDVLVTGPKEAENTDNWMGEYQRESQSGAESSVNFRHSKETPSYVKGV